jgi:hypothetical protein
LIEVVNLLRRRTRRTRAAHSRRNAELGKNPKLQGKPDPQNGGEDD